MFERVLLSSAEYEGFRMRHRDISGDANRQNRYGPEFRYVESWQTLKSGDRISGEGRLVKYIEAIYRTADGKLLGTSIQYSRSGGDFFPLGHWSSESCPTVLEPLSRAVFIEERK